MRFEIETAEGDDGRVELIRVGRSLVRVRRDSNESFERAAMDLLLSVIQEHVCQKHCEARAEEKQYVFTAKELTEALMKEIEEKMRKRGAL